jgi:peptidoglycan/LPS O-acetylase OafA/YrhL
MRHTPALDGIRGLAIILVLTDHLLWANISTGSRLLDFFSILQRATWLGVDLFFALSGFLITGILWETLHKPHYFRNFYARRILRIFPLYYGFLFLIFALTPVLHLHWNGWQVYFLTYTTILVYWRHPSWSLGVFNINQFWSLQVEELFYLMWPLIVFLTRNRRRLVLISLLGCLAALGLRVFSSELATAPLSFLAILNAPIFSRADDLLFGCILALLLRSRYRTWILANASRIFLTCCIILAAFAVYRHKFDVTDHVLVGTYGISIIDIASCCLIAMSLVGGSISQWFFQNPLLRRFGRYSYGMYVYHYTLAQLLIPGIRASVNAHLHSKALAVLLAGATTACVTYVVAFASYHLFEVRFLHFKKYFSYESPKP